MKTNNSRIYLLLVLIFIVFFSNLVLADDPLIAVLPFDEGDLVWKGMWGNQIINGITQQVTDKIVQKENIRVIERNRIAEVMQEQDFGQTGRVDPATAAEIGRILGVDYLILGTLTHMDVKDQGGIRIGPLSISGLKATIVLSGRIVDSTTGEIVDSIRAEAEVSDASISLSQLQDISFGTKAFADSALGKCIDQATTNFVDNIKPERLKPVEKERKEGLVLKIVGDKLIINIGANKSLQKNQIGELIRLIQIEGLSEPVRMPIGRVKVFSVDKEAAILDIVELYDRNETPQERDWVLF
ncbi:MAG TPA: hypothetical protein GXZ20_06695 [Halanaerobiaceae bacterium]|jgi:curli biogenesis system outer membrane secretion channel CsgG|nr:CsgG/HfaB family protein [Bacillota bacterium]HHU92811.1 hypothetical protein [Halanaerobiaceae bacterium]HOA40706.1 CsgG/HfaB family protein [Halanaerobiales bacterium]HPZ63030.1 CsgG/HfaB family protein [Halanaerobiales bacterium]HQD04508.1 CsgG/HfaB family protein [Halanaerobiales bacterium]